MPKTIYRTATTANGYLADFDNSLTWLFEVEADSDDGFDAFLDGVGAVVEGSTTYEWVLRQERLLTEPDRWSALYGSRPVFVLTTRELPRPEGADLRFRSGPIADHLAEIRSAAADRDTWVVGGGEIAGQFFDQDALDEIVLTVVPVFLSGGALLLPRRIQSDRLRLQDVVRRGQFVDLHYSVRN